MLLHSIASLQCWLVLLLGLSHFGVRTDARAVNVSNTWTMPQEGLNVFYRFFRDRISWFEADAVCQFHHANLVTVDNSFQFDATRDLLRELDVNDIVWIGLMRPQSSERFMWSNSRPLVTDTGYWAESLPLMDAPLCAVIDPIRDYRWHALRCGGPETASFLCEMPVPSWADSCILKDMPNLTMQYMADTASIELIRNCAEEGLLKHSCKGKQDRDRALHELICPRERLEAQRINDITNSHFKSLQIINSIRTDNNENNDIELLPIGEPSYGSGGSSDISEQVQTEKNTVQRLIEQFNVDELMQADEAAMPVSKYHIPGEIPKPVKKAAKKVLVTSGGDYPKKYRALKYEESVQLPPPTPKPSKQQQLLALEDMMMGDQPLHSGEPEMMEQVGPEEDEVSNEITEPLPHKKKVLPQDLKTMAPITEDKSSAEAESEERSAESLKGEIEKRVFVGTSLSHSGTTISTTAVPTTTPITTTTTTTTSTTTTATPTIRPGSTVSPLLFTTLTTRIAKENENENTITTQQAFVGANNPIRAFSNPHAPFTTTTVHATSATAAHVTESDVRVYTSSSATLHTTPKLVDFDGTEPAATIGHPMHPQQQQRGFINTEEPQHPHVKESADNSHFIPPMLLVKSHYVPPLKHNEHSGAEHHGIGAHEGASAHVGHAGLRPGDGTHIDYTTHPSHTTNNVPIATTTKAAEAGEADVEAMTTITVTTTMAAVKSTTNAAYTSDPADEFTKEVRDKSISLEQQPKQQRIIDSTTAAANRQQQQQSGTKVNIKSLSDFASEAQDMTEVIEKVGELVPTTTSTAAPTTTAPFTTIASAVNERHSTGTPTTKPTATATAQTTVTVTTTTTTTIPSATKESVDMVVPHVIEKPVKRAPQTKEAEKLIKEMSAKTTNMAVTPTVTAQPEELQTMNVADTTQRLLIEEPTTAAAIIPHENAAGATGARSSPTLTTVTTTTAAASGSGSAAPAMATTSTHTASATATACSSDTDMESTTTDTTVAGAATEDGNGAKLTRVHRTCQPRLEKHSGKHTKHHAKTAEPPTPTRNFMKQTTETPPYKPNRHRILTQPETVSYFKKILG